MKLLGLCCGRKMGNSEILIKEALMGAEELGVDVEIVRLMDLEIKPCTGCGACSLSQRRGEAQECAIKDDMLFLLGRIMESDGLIIGTPVYVLTPPGYLNVFRDRVVVHYNVSSLKEIQRTEGVLPKGIDSRSFKPRVGGFICVGGGNLNWVTLALPLMYTLTYSLQIKIVDQLQVVDVGRLSQVLLNEEAVERARMLGRNVAEAMDKPINEVKFIGDEPGTCPVCHSNLLIVKKKNPVECPICSIRGSLKVDGKNISVIFEEEELKKSRLSLEGRLKHFYEIREVTTKYEQRKDELLSKLEKYRSYKSYSLPTSKMR